VFGTTLILQSLLPIKIIDKEKEDVSIGTGSGRVTP